MTIDAVITEERARVQDETRTFLKRLLEEYGSGILVTDVRLQVADPPEEVRDAFQEVVRARADKERLINEAQAYANDVVPRARGDKQEQIENAAAFKDQQELLATGDAERFLSVLGEYRLAPEVTRERMYLDAVQDVMSNTSKVMVDVEGGNNMMYLPLDKLVTESATRSPGRISLDSNALREITNAVTEQLRRDAAATSNRRGGR